MSDNHSSPDDRTTQARAFLERWEPDDEELPDWIVDEIERDSETQALFDRRFSPWSAGELGRGPVPAPLPARQTSSYGRSLVAVGVLLAAMSLVWLTPGGEDKSLALDLSQTTQGGQAPGPLVVLDGSESVDRDGIGDENTDKRESGVLRGAGELERRVLELEAKIASLEERSRKKGLEVLQKDTLSRGDLGIERENFYRPNPDAFAPQHLAVDGHRLVTGDERQEQDFRWSAPTHAGGPVNENLPTDRKVVVQKQNLRILESVRFGEGQSDVQESASPILDAVAQVLREHTEIGALELTGHTDSTGSAQQNETLSLARAQAVRSALVARGVAPERLVAKGMGESQPIDSNATEQGRIHNARVEFHLVTEALPSPVPAVEPPNNESYTDYGHHSFERTLDDALSTFSIDVDTASYSIARRKLREGYLPPQAAIRVEEFVNAFPYDYPRPPDDAPFGVSFEGAKNPFNPRTHLVRVGVQGKRIAADQRRPVHLTFLVDTSGSMQSDDKLGLVQFALKQLTEQLVDGDTVAIAAYAGSAGLVLPPTPMSRKAEIVGALDRLTAGGSTAMGDGIALAYRQAEASFQQGAVNRVIILSDGDANVGTTSHEVLTEMIRTYANKGITLTTAGFGEGNYKDTMMERLANDGDGNYFYIDSQKQAEHIFVDQLTSTLVVIAKDVKIQVDFDPHNVVAYRLLGYENRDIADEDFRDDAVDAGEIGSGHRVTALYELALAEGASPDAHLATVSVRNKAPGPDSPAVERSFSLDAESLRPSLPETSRDFRIALAAAYFAEDLRGSPHLHDYGLREIASIARSAVRPEYPEDNELVTLIERAQTLSGE